MANTQNQVEAHTLTGQPRENNGTGASRALRRQGMVPAIIYGTKIDNRMISVNAHELGLLAQKASFTSKILKLVVDNETFDVLPREISTHPVSDRIEHLDFFYVGKAKNVQLKVKLKFTNKDKSSGLKLGGTMNIVQRDLLISCAPNDIPQHIEVDVSQMRIGSSIRLNEITLPKGVTALVKDANRTIATISGRGKKTEEGAAAE